MFFNRRKSKAEISAARDAKVAESQQVLLTAAVETSHMAQDVTRTMQKRMEDAVKQFIQTARIMNDALLICDPRGNVTAFNPAAQRIFGLPEQPTAPVTDLFRRGGMRVSADELWSLGRSKKRTLSGIHADGAAFPVHIRVSSLDRSDGSTVILLVVQDLTLIQKNFSNSLHGYAVVAHNEIIAANESVSRIFGYSQDELLGHCADKLMSSRDRGDNHLDLVFEVARILWEGEEAILITIRETKPRCPTCKN
jgi:PAS domain-containing protein